MSQSGIIVQNSSSAGSILEFTGGTGTSGTFPVSPNAFGQVSLSSSDGTITLLGGTNSIDVTTTTKFFTVTGTLTSTQIKNLNATPILAIAPLGAGKVIQVVQATAKMNYGGTNVFIAANLQTIDLFYGNASFNYPAAVNLVGNTAITPAYTALSSGVLSKLEENNNLYDNVGLYLGNQISPEISGNAANDNTVIWKIIYNIVSI